RKGRPSTPAEVVLRMLVLKHLYDWSFDECEREVRGSLVYRAFCRIGCERAPDAKTLIRLSHLLGPDVLKKVLARLVNLARERKVVRGWKLRVDTTVVETNVHYPTDSTLLCDGVRVLTRTLKKLKEEVGEGVVKVRDRSRAMARRVFELAQRSRKLVKDEAKARLQQLYGEVLVITRAVVREANAAVETVEGRVSRVGAALVHEIRETVDIVKRVVGQTRARVFKGDTHYPGKVLSIFEPHTEAIRKGKAAKPTEFGKLVKIQEAEGQFITDYEVCATRVADQDLWVPSLETHMQLFGRPPRMAVADAGFASRKNELAATELGVKRVVLPGASKRSKEKERKRWFRRALRWRTGSEGRISALKRRHGLRRCRDRGTAGIERWVGLGVIANNLLVLGRAPA
ncbi:MAG TPA: ISNCY family transposase, partial [Vicinamibacteria bacterium]|nr:ISNCY family transposase [Vicinamibacteria bacterium]